MNRPTLLTLLCLTAFPSVAALAAPKPISGSFKTDLTGYTLVALSDDGTVKTKALTGKSFSITPSSTKVALSLIDTNNQYFGPIVAQKCTYNKKTQKVKCIKTKVITGFKSGAKLPGVVVGDGYALVKIADVSKYKSGLLPSRVVDATTAGKPEGAGSLGLGTSANVQSLKSRSSLKINADANNPDEDLDGIPNQYDIDDDGDQVLDNYDTDTSSGGGGTETESFRVFSNFKLDIDQSLNYHTGVPLSTSAIDAVMQQAQTLAIEVSGGASASSELNCGTLGYCSAGGTGQYMENNQEFPESFDSDNDGLGTLPVGNTGDFQLRTGASTSTIAAGDTFVQLVDNGDGTTTNIPGMLNYVFHTTPALKTVAITGKSTETVDYAVTPIKGQRGNCFIAPATGDVILTVTAWRPQRPGVDGESQYVDLGNSIYTFDIPNGACTGNTGLGCAPQGPGNCTPASYSTTDPNLATTTNDGVQDSKGDTNADSTNTLTFTVNVTQCLNAASSGAVSWASGQTLFIDFQARSKVGDNAAQKFCVTRE